MQRRNVKVSEYLRQAQDYSCSLRSVLHPDLKVAINIEEPAIFPKQQARANPGDLLLGIGNRTAIYAGRGYLPEEI